MGPSYIQHPNASMMVLLLLHRPALSLDDVSGTALAVLPSMLILRTEFGEASSCRIANLIMRNIGDERHQSPNEPQRPPTGRFSGVKVVHGSR